MELEQLQANTKEVKISTGEFAAHEKRDEDRFESQMREVHIGFTNINEKLDDIKKEHLAPLAEKMDAYAKRLEEVERKQSSIAGGFKFAAYIGIPLLGILLGIISWQSLSIIELNTRQAAIKEQNDAIKQQVDKTNESIKSAVSDQFESYIEKVNK